MSAVGLSRCSADAGEAGGVEVPGDDVLPQLSIIRNSIRAYSLPEWIAPHFVRNETQSNATPSAATPVILKT